MPFGDQGFCLNRENFLRLKGYNEALEAGEDLDFVIRSRRRFHLKKEVENRVEISNETNAVL